MIRGAAALLAAWGLAGCAAISGPAEAPPADAGAAPLASARPSALEVVGPAELKNLLKLHMDLSRVGTLSRDDAIDDTEWSRLIDAAPVQVKELLQTEGFFEPELTLERVGGVGERKVKLTLNPGPRVKVNRVTLEIQGELERAADSGEEYAADTLAELRKAWSLPAGRNFRNPAWTEAKAAALARLRAAGYAGAAWSGTAAEIDTESQTARLFLVAESGPLYRFGELKVQGLDAHDLATVQALAGFARGTPISEALLLDFQERLQKSNLFDSSTVTLDPDPSKAAAANIVVNLREAPLQVFTAGVGVSANTGPRASVDHLYRRVFGLAYMARNNFVWGRLEQKWNGEISTHPTEGQYRTLLGGAVGRLKSSTDVVLSQRLRLGRTQDTLKIERLYFAEVERSARTTELLRENTVAFSLNYQGVWRQLDSVILPTEGFSLSAQGGAGLSRGTDADKGPFTRLYARFTGYLPVGRAWYAQARVEAGQVIKKEAVAVPQSQLWRAGGDDSVRGYSYRSLGPVVDGAVSGGAALLTASLELARPVSSSLPSLWGAVFFDTGNAADNFKQLDLALGAGIGLRWRSPVGPLKLDWAYGREVRKSRIHFSVGIAF